MPLQYTQWYVKVIRAGETLSDYLDFIEIPTNAVLKFNSKQSDLFIGFLNPSNQISGL